MKKHAAHVIFGAMMSFGVAGYIYSQFQHRPLLEVFVFSLKSGRSMLVRTPQDQRILIDGGANSEIIRYITEILPFYSRHIDAILVTNTEGSNVSGLVDVLNRYDVDRVYVPRFTLENLNLSSSSDDIYSTFIDTVKKKNKKPIELMAGDELSLSHMSSNDLNIEKCDDKLMISPEDRCPILKVIFPVKPADFSYSRASAPELLFKISYGDGSILFTGDASQKVQKYIATSDPVSIAKSDVLIVSHSATASNISRELISVVDPSNLVYSKSPTKSVFKTSLSKKKISPDPLAALLSDQRFNIKEKGSVRIIFNDDLIQIDHLR